MRRRRHDALFLALFCATLPALAAPAADGGGRDVSVALFSTRALHAVTLAPLGPDAWTATCAVCAHTPLPAPLHWHGPAELFAGGTLRITDDAAGEARAASGLWHLRAHDHDLDVVLTLPSERYVAAVLNAEAGPNEPSQSLRALAVLARTYALNGTHYTPAPGHLPADLCDSTACQALRLDATPLSVDDAARATAGETLWFGQRRAEVFFSQSCGGTTEDAGALWPSLRGLPYLRSHTDPYCLRRDSAAWHAEVPLAKLAAIAQAEGWHLPANIVAAQVSQRSASHRALRIVFTGSSGATAVVAASALRFGIGRALGWDTVRSDAYDLGVRNGALLFDGRGHGHGVGLCQAGATEMATEGKSAREILAFYFPGTAVRIAPTDEGWQQTQAGPLTLRSAHVLAASRIAAVQQTWTDAQRRFPPRRALAPEIVYAPTTEVFRQLTALPGWALAGTRGTTIVLQPEAILQANCRHASATLLHELLHVLVEAEATDRAPLWLREGLVEALAGESSSAAATLPASGIDAALQHAASLAESQRAHRAAAARVHALLERYGLSTVRGWLSTGVPAGVLALEL